ncbi:MAG TPA: RNA polymerase-binding protein DksA [Steroidobacteraceae bacterium]|jgi:DnaK suppressor protein
MSAKKPAPKSTKVRKPVSRPAARKEVASKSVDKAKSVVALRRAAPQAKKPPPAEPARKAAEPATSHASRPSSPRAATPAPAPAPVIPLRVTPALVTQEAEEGDGSEPGSLLAGPRNVQPYISKRGEAYMSKEQLEHFRQILLSWKRDLMEEVDRTVSHMKDEAANFPDPNDRATQEEEFSLELRTRDRERKLIRKIDEALKRVEDGSYGYCLETGEEIGIKRLEARPVATLTIEAQERRERRERQYGDRDDRYR